MSGDDVTYYQVRAQTEREQAEQATHPQAVRAHSELARAYLERIGSADPQRLSKNA